MNRRGIPRTRRTRSAHAVGQLYERVSCAPSGVPGESTSGWTLNDAAADMLEMSAHQEVAPASGTGALASFIPASRQEIKNVL
jgi:hypothetical protein